MQLSATASAILVAAILALFQIPSSLEQQTTFGQTGSELFELKGKVVNSVTGEGVAHALVKMHASRERVVFTGDDGDFVFTDVPRGSYTVTADKPGFFNEQELRRWNPGTGPTPQAVPQNGEVAIKLTPEGIIYGKVVDENDHPIEGVSVQVHAWVVQDGRRRLLNVARGTSDDQGNFRTAELLPGTYCLRFFAQGSLRLGSQAGESQAGQREERQEGYGAEFYPGVADVASAGAIRLKAGAHVHIEQTLSRQRVYEVSGIVRGGPANGEFALNLMDSMGVFLLVRTQVNQNTGGFRIQGVPAGTYMLSATFWSRSDKNREPENAYVPLRVNADVSGIMVVRVRGASIGVQLDDEREETRGQEETPRVSVRMESREMPELGREIMMHPRKGDRNAPRQLEDLSPGTYTVVALPNGPGYVAELRCGSVDLLRDDLVVPAGATLPPIQVTLRSDGAQISVTALKGGQSVPAMVVIYSEDYLKRTIAGPFGGSGSMTWGNVAPGMYKAFAVDSNDLEFRNPAAMEKYLAHAVEVNLGPNDRKAVRLEVQEAQDSEQ